MAVTLVYKQYAGLVYDVRNVQAQVHKSQKNFYKYFGYVLGCLSNGAFIQQRRMLPLALFIEAQEIENVALKKHFYVNT